MTTDLMERLCSASSLARRWSAGLRASSSGSLNVGSHGTGGRPHY